MKTTLLLFKYRWWIIISTFLLVILCTIPLLKSRINPDLETYLPKSMPAKINNDKIEKIFGKDDPLVIVLSCSDILNENTLSRIRDLSRAFNRTQDFDRVMSLFDTKDIKGESGAMVVTPVIRRIPKSAEAREKLRESIKGNELAYKTLVSEDFQHTLLILNYTGEMEDTELIASVRTILDEFPGDETVTLFGQPYLRAEASSKIARDLILLLPIGLLIMFAFLWISFRDMQSVLLPFSVVLISILVAMALIPLLGWEISVIGILVPIMMIAIANNYGIHVVTRYQELSLKYPLSGKNRIITEIVLFLKNPVILTGLTTLVGIAGLIMHILLPAKQMGVVTVLGIALALLLSLTFIPAFMSLFRKRTRGRATQAGDHTLIYKVLTTCSRWVSQRPRMVIAAFLLFLVVSIISLPRLKVAVDFNNLLPEKHPFNEAIRTIDQEFGGTKYIHLMFNGDMKDPVLLSRLDAMESELKKLPETATIISISDIIKLISKALYDSDSPSYNAIPETRDAVAQFLELYSMNGDPEDFEDFVNFDYTSGLMSIQYRADNVESINRLIDKIDELAAAADLDPVVGGYSLVEKELSHAVTVGQKNSLIFAFFAICLLLIILFRSLTAGLLGSLPLFFAVISTFGIMSWTGTELNIVTALLSSISIGLGVDYTIHLFWRLKKELKARRSWNEAITLSLTTTGRGISINAFSVIAGFSVLFLSSFPLIRSFAFLIISSLFLCLAAALLLIPAICKVWEPRFLQNEIRSNKKTKTYDYETSKLDKAAYTGTI